MDFIKKHFLFIAVLFLVVLNFFLWNRVLADVPNNNLKIYFLDIGQGDATFIEAPNDNQVLIDGGGGDNAVLRELGEVMSPTDRSIDMVIATHPDADHIGGLAEVIERYDVSEYVESGNRTKDTKTFSVLNDIVIKKTKEGMKSSVARRGERFVIDNEKKVYLDVLFPDRDVTNVESNNASIVLRLSYLDFCVILTADASKQIEQYLMNIEGANLDCDVLKVGHHGSRTSSDKKFVEVVSPKYAIISSGKNNRYGHPHKEVIDILSKLGVEILRTDEHGRIELESNGIEFNVK